MTYYNPDAICKCEGICTLAVHSNSVKAVACATPSRDLRAKAKVMKWELLLVSLEMLQMPQFDSLIKDRRFIQHLCFVFIDEAHLPGQWGKEFCKAYSAIGVM